MNSFYKKINILFCIVFLSHTAMGQDLLCKTITAYHINEQDDTVDITKTWLDAKDHKIKSVTFSPKSQHTFTKKYFLNTAGKDSVRYFFSNNQLYSKAHVLYDAKGRIVETLNIKGHDTSKVSTIYKPGRTERTVRFKVQIGGKTTTFGEKRYTVNGNLIESTSHVAGMGISTKTFYDTVRNRIKKSHRFGLDAPIRDHSAQRVLLDIYNYYYNSKKQLKKVVRVPQKVKSYQRGERNMKKYSTRYKYNKLGQLIFKRHQEANGTYRTIYVYGKEKTTL